MRYIPLFFSITTATVTLTANISFAFAANSASSEAKEQTYVVQSGDSLWTIARKFHTSVAALEKENPTVSPAKLRVGSQLKLTTTSTAQASAAVDKVTKMKKGQLVAKPSTTASQNLYWMEHVIDVEANSESLKAQIAVGDVIYNRMMSGTYGGHTVRDVVFQETDGQYQFPSVLLPQMKEKPSSVTVAAAVDVLRRHIDLVPGALVFFNPSVTPTHSWFWSRPKVGQIGDFIFSK